MTLRSPRAQEPTTLPILAAPMGEHPGPEQQHPFAPPLQLPTKPAPCPSLGSSLGFAPSQHSGAPSIGGSTQRPWSGLLGEHSDLLGYKQLRGGGLPACTLNTAWTAYPTSGRTTKPIRWPGSALHLAPLAPEIVPGD